MSNKLCEALVKRQIRDEHQTSPKRSAYLWLKMVTSGMTRRWNPCRGFKSATHLKMVIWGVNRGYLHKAYQWREKQIPIMQRPLAIRVKAMPLYWRRKDRKDAETNT
jgi:hypothetical protein